jgi:NAD(P)-dependent dehydrogenase (short-subunit alcohol dehydrogenase family)
MNAAEPLAGKVAWVTGAGSGIGAAIAAGFVAAGATVVAIDRNADKLTALAERHGDAVATATVDVTSLEQLAGAAAEAVERLGPPHAVMANAGIAPVWNGVAEADEGEWREVIDINLTGAFLTAKVAAPLLLRSVPSTLLFTSSVMGLGAGPGGVAYHASKHGVIGLMRSVAAELSPAGVRVNALCPGWVETPMLDEDIAEAGGDRKEEVALRASQHLIPDLIQPQDVAAAAVFLCSDAAGRLTGVALPVDGGMLEQRQWVSREAHRRDPANQSDRRT